MASATVYGQRPKFFKAILSATAYGQRPKFFRAKHSATAEGENCAYGQTLAKIETFRESFGDFMEK